MIVFVFLRLVMVGEDVAGSFLSLVNVLILLGGDLRDLGLRAPNRLKTLFKENGVLWCHSFLSIRRNTIHGRLSLLLFMRNTSGFHQVAPLIVAGTILRVEITRSLPETAPIHDI